MQSNKIVFKFSFFPIYRPYAEKSLRLGFQVSYSQNSFNVGFPYLLLLLVYHKKKEGAHQDRPAKKPEYVTSFVSNHWFRMGVDKYLGELAFLLPLIKVWLIAEIVSISKNRFRQLTFLQFLLKISLFEIMLKVKVVGLGFYFHIPFYEIGFISRYRERQNRKFFEAYRS